VDMKGEARTLYRILVGKPLGKYSCETEKDRGRWQYDGFWVRL